MKNAIVFLFILSCSIICYAQKDKANSVQQTFPDSPNYNFIVKYFNRTYFMSEGYKDSLFYKNSDKKTKTSIDFLYYEYQKSSCILTVLANYCDDKNLSLPTILRESNNDILSIYKSYNGAGRYIYGSCFEPLPGINLIDIEYLQEFITTAREPLDVLILFNKNKNKK